MADRYQDRPFPADDDYDRGGGQHTPAKADSDPLAELARLIGQTDPFAAIGRANQKVLPRQELQHQEFQHQEPQHHYGDPEPVEDEPVAGPPPWMQRAAVQEAPPEPDYLPSPVHPLRRYATPQAASAPELHYESAPATAHEADYEADPSRYDDALYGQLETGAHEPQRDPAYPDDPYAYQDEYEGEPEPARKRGGLITVAVVLALAVVGTGAAFAYRTYVATPRSGSVPVITADPSPTKIVPAPSDGSSKVPDRLANGDGTEKIVPREEAPVDLTTRAAPPPAGAAPRVVFPPLNANGNPPPVGTAVTVAPPPANNGTMPNAEPRKIRTLSVKGDQPDTAATPTGPAPPAAAKPSPPARAPAAAAPRTPPASANASLPLSLSPQASQQPAPAAPAAPEPRQRVATTTPAPAAPAAGTTGGYLVQVSSQRNEGDAQASFRALQGKFPAVLGSRQAVIKRADLGDKGVYYRAMVGPFGSPDEATQFCGSLKSAGGQCVVQRN